MSPLSGMRIQRLPEELAAPPLSPPVVDPLLLSTPQPVERFVTGVRLPLPAGAGRRPSLRGALSPPGVKMEIDRACTLLVCFHDDASSTGVNSGGGSGSALGGLLSRVSSSSSAAGSHMEIPEWATQMGLSRTSMHVRKNIVEKPTARGWHGRGWGCVCFFFVEAQPGFGMHTSFHGSVGVTEQQTALVPQSWGSFLLFTQYIFWISTGLWLGISIFGGPPSK